MAKRPTPPAELTSAFHGYAMCRQTSYRHRRIACWLAPFDPLDLPCSGKWEAFHFLGKQEMRNSPELWGLDRELMELIEWDPRNGGPGCVGHHRPFDKQSDRGPGSDLIVPRLALPEDTEEFILERGLESLAERRFSV